MMQEPINLLILKVAHKDKDAFEKLYIQMKKPVYFYVLRFCGRHDIAEDVLQDTFITIWSKSDSFIPNGSGRSWILSIAKNKAIDTLKKQQHIISLDEIEDCLFNEEQLITAIENQSLLKELFESITKREADIVVLRHIVGLSLTEIAREKNIKKGTVFWIYNSAIKKMKKKYERMDL